ncbi:MAG: AAA family ATPase [Methanobacteriaceae archaeon]|nr:AAA family ATPase [Methanobacteriaceae archaeon]
MKHYKPLIEHISAKIKEYQAQPSANRVFVLYGLPLSGKTPVAREVAKSLNGKYIDLLKDKLSMLTPKFGLYTPLNLKRDISSWAKETDSLLVIDEIEALLDTWTREQHEDLLKLLSGLGGRMHCPVLIVTRLNLSYEDFMGKDRIFKIS